MSMKPYLPIEVWARRLGAGDRLALSRAITLVESTLERDQNFAAQLLEQLPVQKSPTQRIGITGSPGAGKSSLIEALGLQLCRQGHRVAVLSFDPSSKIGGGSLLGDKTRMNELSHHPCAYVRPSPSGGVLGGIGMAAFSALTLCELAGFDTLFIETVGTGQSESSVAEIVDATFLLMDPGSGDGVQALKKGLLEMVDWLVVTKADGDRRQEAERLRHEFSNTPVTSGRSPLPIFLTSVKEESTIIELAHHLGLHRHSQEPHLPQRRADQAERAFQAALEHLTIQYLRTATDIAEESKTFARIHLSKPQLVTRVAHNFVGRLLRTENTPGD